MPDVFLSYARADDDSDYDNPAKSFMRRLYTALTAEGFDVWWDREKLPARSLTFTDEIEAAIRACDRFVLIAGPGAKTSDYVTAEWMFALAQCKPITPALRVGDYAVIPPEIAGINAIDCRPTRDETAAFKDIINRLREDAPLGKKIGGKGLPRGYVNRPAPFKAARDALMADAIQTTVTVISTPQRETKPGRDAEPQRAVAVYGLGGIGKSTLAAALTDDCDVRRHFRDGVIWLEVGQTPIVASLQAWIGVHFGDNRDNYQNEDDGTRSLSLVLHDKAALLVLDDVWDHKIVERFPVGGTACRLLITTRSGVLASRVEGADIRLDLLTPHEGAQVIAGRTGKSVDDPLYRQISETLGGHTLAVTLAALQIAEGYADDPADLLRLLDKRAQSGEPFRDLAVDADDKDLNLALSLSLSYDALKDDDLRRRFRATGMFALEGSFDRAALAAVWGDADEDDARGALRALVGVGLLDEALTPQPPLPQGEGEQEEDEVSENISGATKGRGGVRYSQHRLLHAYARAVLAGAGEMDAVFERYAEFYTARANTVFSLPPEQWSQHAADLPDITALGDALMERTENGTTGDLVRVIWFANNTTRYVGLRREAHKWTWLEMGLNAARALRVESPDDDTLIRPEALFLNDLGFVWDDLGEKRKALEYYEQALPLRRAVGDRGGEATTLHNIGKVWDDLGGKRKALEYYEQTLPIFRAVGNQGSEAATLTNIGKTLTDLGEYSKALEYYEQALPLRRAVGDRGGEAVTLQNIGATLADLGEYSKALEYYEQALPLSQAVGDRAGEATTLNNIGRVWDDLGEKRKALDYFEQALPLRRAVGDRAGEATTLNNIGKVWDDLGEKRKALDYFEQALPLLCTVENRRGEAITCFNIGMIYYSLEYLDKAIEYVERCVQIEIEVESPNLEDDRRRLEQLKRERDGEGVPFQNTLPAETVNTLAGSTVAVMTSVPERREEWRGEVQRLSEIARRENHQNELALFEALLAILDGETPTLPEGKPYAEVVWRVTQSIEAYHLAAPGGSAEDAQAAFIRQIVALYQEGGAEAVRSAMAEAGAPEETIKDWLAQLAAQFGD